MATAAHSRSAGNPAVSGEQYRLAQAVLSGTAQETRMTKRVAREIVEKTPARMRSEYMREENSRKGPAWHEGSSTGRAYAKEQGYRDLSEAEIDRAADEEIRERKVKDKEYGIKPRIWPRYKLGFKQGYKLGLVDKAYEDARSQRQENPQKWILPFRRGKKNYEDVGYLPFALEHDIGFSGSKMYRPVKVGEDNRITVGSIELSSVDFDRYSRKSAVDAIKKLKQGQGHVSNPDDSPRNWPVFTTFQDTAAGAKEAKAIALKLKINGVLNRCELEGGVNQEWVVRVQALQKGKAWGVIEGRKSNPEDSAASMFKSFHGEPSEEVLEFAEEEHYHSNLAALGLLVEMRVTTLSGYEAEICFEDGDGARAGNGLFSSIFGPSSSKASDRLGPERKARVKARARGSARSSAHSSALKTVSYRGHQIEETEDGFTIPEIDSSVFDTLKDAKEFVSYYKMGARATNPDSIAKIHDKLSHAVTAYDMQEQKKKFYNRYALSQYLGAVQRAMSEIEGGKPVRAALVGNFNGRLLDRVLKAVGEEKGTIREQREGNPGDAQVGELWEYAYKARKGGKWKTLHATSRIKSISGNRITFEDGRAIQQIAGDGGEELVRRREQNPSSVPAITMLCSNEAGTQLYLVGGDQSLDLKALHMSGDKWEKDSMVIGDVTHICYHARKVFGGKAEEFDYEHEFSEDDDGPLPQLRYDKKSEKLHLDGGSYVIKQPLLGTSAGIEN